MLFLACWGDRVAKKLGENFHTKAPGRCKEVGRSWAARHAAFFTLTLWVFEASTADNCP
jgi:hypothetical protein